MRVTLVIMLLLILPAAGCGPDRPVTQSTRSLCDAEELVCEHPEGLQIEARAVEDCDAALERWEDCGLTRADVQGCRDAIDRCEPLPSSECEPGDGIGCVIPECDAMWACDHPR